MHGPDGTDYSNSTMYGDVTRLKRLVILHDESKEFGIAAWRAEVTFDEIGGKTRITMAGIFASVEEKTQHAEDFHAVEGAEESMNSHRTDFLKSTT